MWQNQCTTACRTQHGPALLLPACLGQLATACVHCTQTLDVFTAHKSVETTCNSFCMCFEHLPMHPRPIHNIDVIKPHRKNTVGSSIEFSHSSDLPVANLRRTEQRTPTWYLQEQSLPLFPSLKPRFAQLHFVELSCRYC